MLLFALGCGGAPPGTFEALPELRRIVSTYGLRVEPAETAIAHLAYRAPDEQCPQVYRLRARYEPALLHEDESTSHLVLGHAERRTTSPSPRQELFEGEAVYRGVRAETRAIVRDFWLMSAMAGPAAPTAACFPRTWDPIEDAFALAWPRLPARAAAVGERWAGLRVEGKCNRSACIDPQTGAGGPDNHHRTCVTPSWQETLVGVYEIDSERVALLRRHWSDGHGEQGIQTEGSILVSLDHGRPVWAQVVVHHAFPQLTADDGWAPIRRTWTLEAIDDCPGSLAHFGWNRPRDADLALHDILEDFARSDALRSGRAPTSAQRERNDADAR